MKDLAKHIEALLLENDCVIVPGLGGFVAHYVPAKYDEEEALFLPPMRTVGFNPQLTINDSLLAQSYASAYSISISEASERIGRVVKEIKTQLDNFGKYEIHHIGLLSVNSFGKMEFAPNDAGILSPRLYALDGFRILPLLAQRGNQNNVEDDSARIVVLDEATPKTVTFKVSTLRRVAIAAVALLALVLFIKPIDSSKQEVLMSGAIPNVMPKNITTGTPNSLTAKNPSAKSEQKTQKNATVSNKESSYCIVLASGTQRKNAEYFTEGMHKKGFAETRLYQDRKDLKVIYGSYDTDREAYATLNQLRHNKDFKQAWVLKTNE